MAPNTASAHPRAEPLPLPDLSRAPLADVLRLIRTPQVGPVTFFHLLRRFGTAAEALAHLPDMARRGGGKAPPAIPTQAQVEKEIAATEKFGARFLRYGEADYPALLHHIPDPPPVLTLRGSAALWQENACLGMVGARNASAGGCSLAQKLAHELAAHYCIVSGLARGIDTFAHRGALHRATIGVIACGIDVAYPPENASLTSQLFEKGAVLTEQAFGTAPFAGSFPGRNRIISGMSLGTLVVEASLKSGSLITARYAAEQGREVFAVPGSPLDARAHGGNALLKQGAHLVESAADVVDVLSGMRLRMEESATPPYLSEHLPEPDEQTLAEARASVLAKLSHVPVSVDELLAQCQVTYGLLAIVLLELELAGLVRRHPGNHIALTPNP